MIGAFKALAQTICAKGVEARVADGIGNDVPVDVAVTEGACVADATGGRVGAAVGVRVTGGWPRQAARRYRQTTDRVRMIERRRDIISSERNENTEIQGLSAFDCFPNKRYRIGSKTTHPIPIFVATLTAPPPA
jgi:hypothetical protein